MNDLIMSIYVKKQSKSMDTNNKKQTMTIDLVFGVDTSSIGWVLVT